MAKAPDALRTIGELAAEIGRPAHILRYWEQRFPQLRPLTRAGGRRHYRPDDVALVKRIDRLLAVEGYTLDGVARVLEEPEVASTTPDRAALKAIRDQTGGRARRLRLFSVRP